MPALNYQQRFAPLVRHGHKSQTIRATRKNPIRAGDPLYHYTGMRTAHCRFLGSSVCTMERTIRIRPGTVLLDGQSLYLGSIKALAKADGFDSVDEFFEFFRQPDGGVFVGQLISWVDLKTIHPATGKYAEPWT